MHEITLSQDINQDEVPQDGVGTIVLMFAWPAVWFSLLIYQISFAF